MNNTINSMTCVAKQGILKLMHKLQWRFCLALAFFIMAHASVAALTANAVPVARITTPAALGAIPFTSSFDASLSRDPDGAIVSYRWRFGDGTEAIGIKASHVYTVPGVYTVTLMVSDNKGASGSASVIVTVIVAPAPTPMGSRPVGIYSLDNIIDLPYVAGVTIRAKWSELEPSEGLYDFSKIERLVRQATLIGQSVTLATRVVFEPTWLMAKTSADNKYQGVQGIDIVPWDENMLLAMQNLAQAESNFMVDGVALKNHPNVKQIDAPVGTANSIRLINLPKNYTADLYKQSVRRSIRIWADAYPDKHIYTGLFTVKDGTRTTSTTLSTADSLRDQLLQEFNGIDKSRINFFVEFWTGLSPVVNSNTLLNAVKDQTSIMLQACGAWTGQDLPVWAHCKWIEPIDSPMLGFNHALGHLNVTYFEMYQDDLLNPNYTNQLEAANINILNLANTLN